MSFQHQIFVQRGEATVSLDMVVLQHSQEMDKNGEIGLVACCLVNIVDTW